MQLWTVLIFGSDRVEVEWKYILKLHPNESQRPTPSANAKPLPEHLKETDASLDITNRTDGVPEIGDPFHDPNSEQKWAEWHTAPNVTQKVAKVDFGKENRLWYYLGKPSTEARPQYTENLAIPRNNPKSNFLETVKPPPPPVPTFNRPSYSVSYPLKPAPINVPPYTPMQQQTQTSRPYQYKPKETMVNSWKSPVYNPDTRKNPNSPVAHQPNVSYDHRMQPAPNGQAPHQGYHSQRPLQQQQYQYHPYVPPQGYSTSTGKTQPSTSEPGLLAGIERYAHLPQSTNKPPAYPYTQSPQQLPPSHHSQGQGHNLTPTNSSASLQSQGPSHRNVPLSHTPSNPSGPPKPPMYAITPSSSVVYAAQSPTEYLAYVTNYPYLKNAYLRRAKTYVSPYSLDGGIAPEWRPKPPTSCTSGTPTAIAPRPVAANGSTHSQGYYHAPPATGKPVARPSAQFQSPDAFQREMARTSQPADGAPKWEQMLKQLATSTGPAAVPTTAASSPQAPQPRYPPPGPRSGLSYELPRSMQAVPSHTPPLPSREPQRPTPSPISDDEKDSVTVPVQAPESAPLEHSPNQVHGGETWRYS